MNLFSFLPVNPLIYAKFAASLVLIAVLGYAYHHIYQSGYSDATAVAKVTADKLEAEAKDKLAEANRQVKLAEQTFAAHMTEIDSRYKELQNAEDKNKLDRAMFNNKRVSVPVTNCSPAGQTDSKATPSVDQSAGTGELEQSFAASLAAIAADGDQSINRLNTRLSSCVDAYEEFEKEFK